MPVAVSVAIHRAQPTGSARRPFDYEFNAGAARRHLPRAAKWSAGACLTLLGLGLVLYFDRLFYDVRAREQLIEEGEQAVRAQMKDVSSATFNNIHLSKSGKGVCGQVKGYISLGAYDGRFIYSGNGAAYLENDDNGDGFKKVWASSCQ